MVVPAEQSRTREGRRWRDNAVSVSQLDSSFLAEAALRQPAVSRGCHDTPRRSGSCSRVVVDGHLCYVDWTMKMDCIASTPKQRFWGGGWRGVAAKI